jgi:hypothetical protein
MQPNEPSHQVAMCQIFGASSAHRAWSCAAIIIFRATPLRQVGSSPIEVTLQVSNRWCNDRSQADASAFTAVASPNLGEHHGIVMDWPRCGLEQPLCEKPA